MNTLYSRVKSAIFNNILRSGMSFSLSIWLVNSLTIHDYGRLGYLVATIPLIFEALNAGTSNAFYTYISKFGLSKKHLTLYFLWSFFQLLFLVSFLYFLVPDSLFYSIFQGESKLVVFFSVFSVYLQQRLFLTLTQIAESFRLTHRVQWWTTFYFLFLFLISVLFDYFFPFSLIFYLLISSGVAILFLVIYIFLFYQKIKLNENCSLSHMYYFEYCKPLVVMMLVSSFFRFSEPWILGYFNTKDQQAYLSVAISLSALVLLASKSVLNILWKEISHAISNGNLNKAREIFSIANDCLFFLSCFIVSIVIFNLQFVLDVLLPDGYKGITIVVSLMFISTIDQVRNQIVNMVFLALEKTRITMFLSISTNIFGLVLTCILVGGGIGFSLGAQGIAIKLLVVQFISANIGTYYLSRILNYQYDFFSQFKVYIILFCLSYFCHFISSSIFYNYVEVFVSVFSNVLLVGILIVYRPGWVNMDNKFFPRITSVFRVGP